MPLNNKGDTENNSAVLCADSAALACAVDLLPPALTFVVVVNARSPAGTHPAY